MCDDGSTDNTEETVREFSGKLDIKYLKSSNFGGPARPQDLGLRIAKGKFVAFLDADDWWCSNKLTRSIETLNSGADITYHDLFLTGLSSFWPFISRQILKTRSLKSPVFEDLLLNGNAINLSSVVVRRSVMSLINGFSEDKDLIAGEDYEAWIRLSKFTEKFERINEPLGFIGQEVEI